MLCEQAAHYADYCVTRIGRSDTVVDVVCAGALKTSQGSRDSIICAGCPGLAWVPHGLDPAGCHWVTIIQRVTSVPADIRACRPHQSVRAANTGAVITRDDDRNDAIYGKDVPVADVLAGRVPPPKEVLLLGFTGMSCCARRGRNFSGRFEL